MKLICILICFFIGSTQILPQGFICAVGGGSEDYNSWSDDPYGWIVEKSDSGKIFVLSYSDQTNWIPDYFKSLGAASAENIKIPSKSVADQQATYDNLITAKAVFIKGGDQWKYLNYWKGTKTEDAIKYIYQQGGVVAGTSAGAMVLGDIVFTAKYGSAYSKQSLINPFNSSVNLEDDFLDLAPNIVFDTHFVERGRFGRLIAFIFNSHINFGKDILGIGIDDHTALCIDENMIAKVFGSGSVSIFQKDELTEYSGANFEYSIENLRCDQLLHNWSYNLNTKKIIEYPESVIRMNNNKLLELPSANIWLSGSDNIQSNINYGLKSYLHSVNDTSVGLILNKNNEQYLVELTNYFTDNNIHYNIIPVEESSQNNPESLNNIQEATCFIIAFDNLQSITYIQDTTSEVGNIIKTKINSGTPVYALGNTGKIIGANYISNTDRDIYASYYGTMTNNTGLNIFGDLIFQPTVFENSDLYENRTSALLYGLMRNRKKIGIYSDDYDFISIDNIGKIISAEGKLPLMIIDARKTSVIDSSHYITKASRTRQTVGMDNLRYTISKIKKNYSLEEGKLINLTLVEDKPNIENRYSLSQNYPNPFNSSTKISFAIYETSHIRLNVYDVLGKKIAELLNKEIEPGEYSLDYDANSAGYLLSSGIYFYSLLSAESVDTKKMVYLK